LEEYERGTDPLDADSDNDGHAEGTEVSPGADPLDAGPFPIRVDDEDTVYS